MALQSTHGPNEPVVYIVDDDESMRLALDGLFRSVGLQVQSFASTQDFVAFPARLCPAAWCSMCVCVPKAAWRSMHRWSREGCIFR